MTLDSEHGPSGRPDISDVPSSPAQAAQTRRLYDFMLGPDERERLKRREPASLDAFFESHFDAVYSLAFRLTGERHAAEDVSQETFYRVYRSIDRLDVSRAIGPWLTAIIYNTCRTYWRRERSRSHSSVSMSPHDVQATASSHDPEGATLNKERDRIVQAAILELPYPLRVAIVMHDYHGLTHEEIARATSVSHAAARKRYSRAIEQLSRILKRALSS